MRPVSFVPIENCCNFVLTHPPLGIDMLEGQVKEAKQMVEESDIKYDEIARKSAMVEGDLQRTEERADTGENTIINLEQELQDIGENLKSLEVAEEKAVAVGLLWFFATIVTGLFGGVKFHDILAPDMVP